VRVKGRPRVDEDAVETGGEATHNFHRAEGTRQHRT